MQNPPLFPRGGREQETMFVSALLGEFGASVEVLRVAEILRNVEFLVRHRSQTLEPFV